MSTKIYNGWRFHSQDIAEILSAINEFRAEVARLTTLRMATLLADKCTAILDAARIDDLPVPDSLLSMVAREVRDRQKAITSTGSRDPEVDFDCEIALLLDGREWLGLLYTEQEDVREAFARLMPASPHPWWDNVDPPEDVTPEAWAARGAQWDRALGRKSPAERGLIANLTIRADPRAGEVAAAQAPKEKRAHRIARDRIVHEHIQRDAKPESSTGEISGIIWRTRDWLQTPEGVAELARRQAEICGRIPEAYSEQEILNWA